MKILPPVSIEARRLLPSRWDLLAAILVLSFIIAFADASRLLVGSEFVESFSDLQNGNVRNLVAPGLSGVLRKHLSRKI